MKVFLAALLALGRHNPRFSDSFAPEASFAEGFRRLGAVITLLAVMLTLDIMFRGTDGWLARMFGKSVFSCLTVIPALALLPLVVSLHALRTGASTSPAAAGGLAGLALLVWPSLPMACSAPKTAQFSSRLGIRWLQSSLPD